MKKYFTLSFIVAVFAVIGLLPILQMFVNSIVIDGYISFITTVSLKLFNFL